MEKDGWTTKKYQKIFYNLKIKIENFKSQKGISSWLQVGDKSSNSNHK